MVKTVLSLFDYTGIMVEPWAEAGYECFIVDIQHSDENITVEHGAGSITKLKLDLDPRSDDWEYLREVFAELDPMIFAFPVCTDLAYSGSKHWAGKAATNPNFQTSAAMPFFKIEELANALKSPYMIENPQSRARKLFREPDFSFDPYMYGGYLSVNEPHPEYPDVIPLQDRYEKNTCIWHGNGFVEPTKNSIDPVYALYKRGDGRTLKVSPIVAKTGGKSLKTKNIRSATPRGFARAVFYANGLRRG